MKKTTDFTEGKIFLPLITFALPVLAALFLQTLYGMIDLWVVGIFAETRDVSAVSTGSMVMHCVTVMITGLAMGITVLIGRRIGEGRREEAGKIIGNGIWLFGLVSAALTVCLMFFAEELAAMMKAPEEAFEETVAYIRVCSGGTIFIVAYNLVGSIFRGLGDSKTPLVTVAIASVCNVVGDLVLVAGFGMGAAGAAYATVFAQGISVVLSMVIMRRKELPFRFSLKDIRFSGENTRRILLLGTPVALQDTLVSISFMSIQAIVNGLGVEQSAAVGISEKLCGFIMLISSAYMQSMSAFVAQNMGANKPERAKKALWCGMGSSVAVSLVIAVFIFFRGGLLVELFSKDALVIAHGGEYMRSYAFDTLFTAFLFCFIGYYNGCGNTLFVMLQGIIGAIGIRLPLARYISTQSSSLFHIGLATPASTLVQIFLCFGFLWFLSRRQKRKELLKQERIRR